MRSIKFDQLGRKALSPQRDAAALAAGPTLAPAPITEPALASPRLTTPSPRPPSDSDAAVPAGSPEP